MVSQADKLKAAGFSDADIAQHTQELANAGFSEKEINDFIGGASEAEPRRKPSGFNLDTLKDVGSSAATGLAQGTIGLVGLPGTVDDIINGGLTAGANWLTGANRRPTKSSLSGEALNQKVSNLVGGYHEPQTTAGDYAQTIGQFAPGVIGGPAGLIPKVASVVVPALASEALGQATRGTGLETPARIAGALLAPVGVGALKRGGTSLANALSGKKAASVVDEVAPTIAQTKSAAHNLYEAVKSDPSKNVIISKNSLSDLATKVRDIAVEHGYKPSVNRKTAIVIKDVFDLPKNNSTLMGLETTRSLAGNVAKDYGTSDGALSARIHQVITDFMDDLGDKDIIGTAANAGLTKSALAAPNGVVSAASADLSGVDMLGKARAGWRTMKKAQVLQNIVDNANIKAGVNYSQAGANQAIQRGFANLATNPKKLAQFSKDEQRAIVGIATGSKGHSVLNFLSRFSVRGPISAAVTTGLGHLALGPLGPYILSAAAEAARHGAAASTETSVNALNALVRGGPGAAQKLQAIRASQLANKLKTYVAPTAGTLGYAAQPVIETEQ